MLVNIFWGRDEIMNKTYQKKYNKNVLQMQSEWKIYQKNSNIMKIPLPYQNDWYQNNWKLFKKNKKLLK